MQAGRTHCHCIDRLQAATHTRFMVVRRGPSPDTDLLSAHRHRAVPSMGCHHASAGKSHLVVQSHRLVSGRGRFVVALVVNSPPPPAHHPTTTVTHTVALVLQSHHTEETLVSHVL